MLPKEYLLEEMPFGNNLDFFSILGIMKLAKADCENTLKTPVEDTSQGFLVA